MCECSDNPPVFYEAHFVRGRKDHECSECLRVIPKGERHEYAKGLWEGLFDDFRTCATCKELVKQCGITCYCHGLLMDELDVRDFPDVPAVREFFARREENWQRLAEARRLAKEVSNA